MIATDQLADVDLFLRLTDTQRATVAGLARETEYPDGAVLFAEGEPAEGCWVIRTGRVALTTAIPDRGEVVVQTLGPGDVIGWSWLVPPHHWHVGATAAGATSTIQLDTVALRRAAEDDPALGYPLALALFEALLARLQATRARLLDVYGSPRGR